MLILIAFSSESERDKFDYLFNKYKKLMIYKAFEILNDARLAEDAASEAFIRVYKNLHKISDTDSNSTAAFLITIVKNTALTLYKKEKSRMTEPFDEITGNDRLDGFSLESHVISQMSADKIYSVINKLGDIQRQVFLLKYAYGMKHSEIAVILKMTETNVTVTLHRAKKKLAELLEKEGYGTEVSHDGK